ncbi:hypothetical protein HAX54_014427, partial [Datura stramonium]|nr:hypothetical protein [Datura stramonium]
FLIHMSFDVSMYLPYFHSPFPPNFYDERSGETLDRTPIWENWLQATSLNPRSIDA